MFRRTLIKMLFLCVFLFATSSLAASLNDYDVGNRTKRGR